MPLALPNAAVKKYSQITSLKEYINEVFWQVMPDRVDINLNRVLCAAYIGTERTPGGIIKPQDLVAEDVWQGKAALVLKVGRCAFKDTPDVTFNGFTVAPGDWVTFKVAGS